MVGPEGGRALGLEPRRHPSPTPSPAERPQPQRALLPPSPSALRRHGATCRWRHRCIAKTLWVDSAMRQVPMLAVVLCRSRTKSKAWPEALGPSSWFSSRALVTSYGSSGWALALQGQGWGITTHSLNHQRLNESRGGEGASCAGRSEPLRPCRSHRPLQRACPSQGSCWLPEVQTLGLAWPGPLASPALTPATLPAGLTARPVHLLGPSLETPFLLSSPG